MKNDTTTAPTPVGLEWVRGLPKAEVHVHLEGCIPMSVVRKAARDAGQEVPEDDRELFSFTDLASFLEYLDWSCGLITEREQLYEIAYDYGRRNLDTGIRYADVIINPTHWPSWRHRLDDLVDALHAGFSDGEADGHVPVGLCLSVKRNQTSSEAIELVEWIVSREHPRVVALSIDGNEAAVGRTGARFADAFRMAADKGVHRCVHAGESSGPEGIRDALDYLLAERIDHGVRAVEDPSLVTELADRRVFLDVCPTSNVLLGIAPSLAAHPVEPLRQAGVPLSLNTDDPLLFGTDVAREYCTCAQQFGWGRDTVASIARTSIEACFANDDLRATLLRDLQDYLARTA